MNRILLRLGRVVLLVAVPVLAHATNTFGREWHWFLSDQAHSVDQLAGGDYVAGGETEIDSFHYGMVLARTDSSGDTTKVRQFRNLDQGGGFLCRVRDSGYAILGTRDTLRIFVHKFTAAGDSSWTYLSPYQGRVSALAATGDGGCLIVGRIPDTLSSFGLIKLDAAGHEQWARYYPESRVFQSWAHGAVQTHEGGYIACGDANDYSGIYVRLARVSPTGDSLWTRLYTGLVGPSLSAVRENYENGFLAVGSVFDTLAQQNQLLMMRTTSSGSIVWLRYLALTGAATQASAMCATRDGGYAIVGTVDWGDSARVWLVRASSTGDTLWTKILRGTGRVTGADIKQTADDGFVITASTDALGGSLALIKTDALGEVATGVAETGADSLETTDARGLTPRLSVFIRGSNPVRGIVRISYALPRAGSASLRLYDVAGSVAQSLATGPAASGLHGAELDATRLPRGIYILALEANGTRAAQKLIIE